MAFFGSLKNGRSGDDAQAWINGLFATVQVALSTWRIPEAAEALHLASARQLFSFEPSRSMPAQPPSIGEVYQISVVLIDHSP